MKKKLVAIVIVAIVLAGVLSGCTLFTKNEERDYNQVLATVESRGITATITKGEFYEYFQQNAPTYMQYYGWTAARCFNEFMNALGKKEVVLIEAKHYYSQKNAVGMQEDAIKFLTENEQNWVINRTNKTFQDSYDNILKQKVEDEKANTGTEDETEEESKLPSPRTEYPDKDDESEYKSNVVYEKEEYFFDAMDKKVLNDLEKKSLSDLKKNIKNQYKSYDFYLTSQAESRLLSKYQTAVKDGEMEGYKINITDEEVAKEYNLQLNKEHTNNLLDSKYTAALDGDSIILYHNNQYVKVKSILLKFSEKQTALLKSVQDYYNTNTDVDDLVKSFRDMLVFGAPDGATFPFPVDAKQLQLLVHVSNLEYDVNAICEDKECTCKNCENNPNYDKADTTCDIKLEDENGDFILNVPGCTCVECKNNAYEKYNVPYADVINELADAVAKAATDAESEYATKYPNGNDAGKKLYVAQAKVDEFDKWMYKINDDPGIFEKGEYVGTPEGKTSEYVTEYTALIRAMMKDNPTKGQMSTVQTDYTVDGKKVTIHTITTDDGNKISYIVNDFGVHIVMMSTVPVDKVVNGGELITSTTIDKDTFYTLGMDAIVGFDDETGLPITVKEQLRKEMEEQAKTDLYAKYEKEMLKDYGKIMFAEQNKDVFKVDKKVMNELIKLLGAEKADINIK